MSAFTFQRFRAFGWVVHRKQLAAGEKFKVHAAAELNPANAPDIAVWTRGRVAVSDMLTGERLPDRVPGDSILKRGRTRKGEFWCTALEPSEFWCISSLANRGKRPQLDLLDIEPDAKAVRLLHDAILCAGAITIDGKPFEAPQAIAKGTRVVVIERAIGFYVKGK